MGFLNDLGLLLLRVISGAMMIAWHGLSKLSDPSEFIGHLVDSGYPLPTVMGYAAISAETLFPLLIILGFFTRVSSVIAAGNMLVAAVVHHMIIRGDSLADTEMALLYFLAFGFLALAGPGKWTLGRLTGMKIRS